MSICGVYCWLPNFKQSSLCTFVKSLENPILVQFRCLSDFNFCHYRNLPLHSRSERILYLNEIYQLCCVENKRCCVEVHIRTYVARKYTVCITVICSDLRASIATYVLYEIVVNKVLMDDILRTYTLRCV